MMGSCCFRLHVDIRPMFFQAPPGGAVRAARRSSDGATERAPVSVHGLSTDGHAQRIKGKPEAILPATTAVKMYPL